MSLGALLAGPRVGWSPLDLGPDLLAFWDSRYLVTALVSDLVTSWKDPKFGYNHVQATDAAKPTYDPVGAWVTGDGSTDQLTLAGTTGLPTGATPGWEWCVGDQLTLPAVTSATFIASWGSSAGTIGRSSGRISVDGVNRARATAGDGSATIEAINPYVDFSGRHTTVAKLTATTLEMMIDGVGMTPVAVVPAVGTTRNRFFASAGSSATGFANYRFRARLITRPLSALNEMRLLGWCERRLAA